MSRSLVGIAGAHFVAAELSQRGIVATVTSRNTEGIDVLASSTDGLKTASIQVKTSGAEKSGKEHKDTVMRGFEICDDTTASKYLSKWENLGL